MMATAKLEEVKDNFLTCVVCHDFYTDPCTLNCQHSFFRKCITNYTKTKPRAVRSRQIPCPSCRQMSNVPNPTRPVEEWAQQFKPGIVVLGLMDTMRPDSKSGDTFGTEFDSCSPCHHLEETSAATTWCQECELSLCDRCAKMHRFQPTTCDHDLCDIGSKVTMKRKRKVMCQEHSDEQVKLHCKDCHKSLCHLCAVIYHKKCEAVVTITSMLSDIKTELSQIRRNLSRKEFVTRTNTENMAANINRIKRERDSAKDEIKAAALRIIEQINLKEKQLTDKLEEITLIDIKKLQADVKTGEIEMQTYRQYSEYISHTLNSDCEMELYDMFLTHKSGQLDIKQDSNSTEKARCVDFVKFTQNMATLIKTLDDYQLGEIDIKYQDVSSAVLYDTTGVKTEEDELDLCLEDVEVLNVSGVQTAVVCDTNNKCLKSVYTRNEQTYVSTLRLVEYPCGITQFQENKVMVTVPNDLKIVTVTVTPDLVLLSTINTSKVYFSLAVLGPASLAAGGEECVDFLNMEGKVLKSVTTHNNVKLFAYPFHMCANKRQLFVSDWHKKTVTCLTSNGGVVWIYSSRKEGELCFPEGITTTRGGSILMADTTLKKVIQLTESGQFVRDVVTSQDGLCNSQGIYLDKNNSLFVCDNDTIKEFILMSTQD